MDHRLLDYEQEFLNSFARFKAAFLLLREVKTSDNRRSGLAKCAKLLHEAERSLLQLELEARMPAAGVDVATDGILLKDRANSYQKELKGAAHEFRDFRAQTERLMLVNEDGTSLDQAATQQRLRLLNATETAQSGVRTLESSRILALETEAMGASVLTELRGQRETIERAGANIGRVREGIREAAGSVQRMVRAALQRKLVIYGLIVLVLLTLAFVIFRKIFSFHLVHSKEAVPSQAAGFRAADRQSVSGHGPEQGSAVPSPGP
ncbi:vesicle transport v-snare protein [Cystoisospora suis]|uniref:Vesicle transport v-snare protein n=1 Tax=Cystoisospora suis TaxID=483139 RepID=A0A2C6LFG0_9APIC|nr:vesicle transport v-snare protein [Cystoisospora suis]